MVQLSRIHVKDCSPAAGTYGSRFPHRRGKGKGSYGTAHVAEDYSCEEEPEGHDVGIEEYEEEPEEEEETIEVDDEALALQLNPLEEIGATTDGESPSEEVVADLIQTEMVAHVAWSSLPRKGKGKKGKGNSYKSVAPQGNGKGKGSRGPVQPLPREVLRRCPGRRGRRRHRPAPGLWRAGPCQPLSSGPQKIFRTHSTPR